MLDPHGWAEVDRVLAAIRGRFGAFGRADLDALVRADEKSRYAFDEGGTRIRASQGHSVPVDLGLEQVEPPALLYHGTVQRFLGPILRQGLLPGKRHHVHLSGDIAAALKLGSRRGGDAVVLEVASGAMREHGFFRSANGVWLVAHVPPEYLRVLGPAP